MSITIKTVSIVLVCIMMCYQVSGAETVPTEIPPDTIEIHFGDKGKIIIQIDNEEDLKVLKEYDVNLMLEDIDLTEYQDDSLDIVIIEDKGGEKYLKSENLEEDSEFRELEDEFDNNWADRNPEPVPSDAIEEQVVISHAHEKKHKSAGTTMVSFFDFGMNNWIEDGGFPDENNAQYTVRPWGSWYVELKAGMQTHVTGKFAIDYGGGISWYNLKFQDSNTRMVKGEDQVIFTTWDPEVKASKSKLTVAHINAHFVPVFDFGYRKRIKTYEDGTTITRSNYNRNGFRIGAGGYVGYRIDSYSKLVSRKDGHKSKYRERSNYYLNNLRYGVRVLIGYGEVDFFVNYDLNTMFAEDHGPQLNAFSFGVSF